MGNKIPFYVIAAVFFLFAAFQYNDPDPLFWMVMYGFVGVLYLLAGQGKFYPIWIGTGFGVSVVTLFLLVPDFINWIQMGTPNIAGSMKTEEPHVELTREFLGALICIGALGYLYYINEKSAKHT